MYRHFDPLRAFDEVGQTSSIAAQTFVGVLFRLQCGTTAHLIRAGAFPAMCYGRRVSLTSTLAHAQFREHFHVCAFVTGPAEERAVIDPFFVEGFRCGHKAVYYVDPSQRDEHDARLKASAPSPDMVEVTTWHDAHLKGGSFDQERMMTALEEMIRDNASSGRPTVRLVGQMGWAFSSPPGIEQLVAYEASVNEVLNRGKTPTVCVYDVRRLSGSMMMDLLRAHPLTVVNGVLHENPYYTPPGEMLRDIQRRHATA